MEQAHQNTSNLSNESNLTSLRWHLIYAKLFFISLVVLLVSLVIISILAALTLSGLATVRRRAKDDATRSSIRKIHEIIAPMYEGYLDKRLPAGVSQLGGSRNRLALEMPDNWDFNSSYGAPTAISLADPDIVWSGVRTRDRGQQSLETPDEATAQLGDSTH